MQLIIQVVVGYMYKVMKNEIDITKFRSEFASIRHGDYYDFVQLIGKSIDFIVVWNEGKISKDTKVKKEDIDFVGLVKAGNSLNKFYVKCLKEYGEIQDVDLIDEYFEKAALFELSLRMHHNNKRIAKERITLENVIEELAKIKDFTNQEVQILHNGRRFLNSLKRPSKRKSEWSILASNFDKAYTLLLDKKLTIL